MANCKPESLMVAAIDFGTTYSGYAFSFKHDYDKDPANSIKTNSVWIAGHKNLFSLKTPTCVLLDQDGEFSAFGYEAEDKYTQLANEDLHEGWMFFKRFKMKLHDNMMLNRGYVISDVTGEHELPAKKIFSHGIRFLKEHLMEHISRQGVDALITKDDDYVTWVLTVPAIWTDSAKQFMREAAQEAGIKPSQLVIALEPEAAALYCRTLPVEKISGCGGLTMFQPDTEYMVLDLGGGTVDVTVQRVLHNNKLKELHKASGGAWGGTKVDDAFKQLLMSIVGAQVIKRFSTKSAGEELELFREFETKKRTIDHTVESKVTMRIPLALSDAFEEEYEGETLKDMIKSSKYSGKMRWTADKLRVEPDVVRELFEQTSQSIVDHVRELLQHPKCSKVDTIIMVGGFSDCKIVQEAVKTNFKDKRILIPEEAGLAIVKGAIMFGYDPKTIVSRKTKFTYGIETTRKYRLGDPADLKFNTPDNKEQCNGVFSLHVGINKSVLVGEPLEPKSYFPLYKNQDSICLPVYVSTESSPKYTNDKSCSYLGKLTLPLPPGTSTDSEIVCRMTFGGTEITVAAEDKNNPRNTIQANFDFLDH